jgi:hypothetical protein
MNLSMLFCIASLERFKKYCSHSEREFLDFGEALAKEHANRSEATPVSEKHGG